MHTHAHVCTYVFIVLHTQMFGKSKEMHKEIKSMIALDRKVSNNTQAYACMQAYMYISK